MSRRWALAGGVVGLGAAYYTFRGIGEKVQEPTLKDAVPINVTNQSLQDKEPALDPNSWKKFKVWEKEDVTHNTVRLKFGFPDDEQVSGLTVASCLLTRAPLGEEKEDGSKKQVIRPYTPENLGDQKGYLDLIVKGYPQGVMSRHIVDLKRGDELEFKGPIPKLPYESNMKKKMGMIAGGSGLTPMLQIIKEIIRNPEDKTEVSFIFANQSVEDIILKRELDEIDAKHPNINIHYLVDTAPENGQWEGEIGYLTKELGKKWLPEPSPDNLVLVCGPPGMMKAISGEKAPDKSQGELSGILAQLGYTKDQVYKF